MPTSVLIVLQCYYRGCTKEIYFTRPHNWTARCAFVWDRPSTTMHWNSQLWRCVDLENWRISPTEVAGSWRPYTLSLFTAVLHITLWIQDVCTHLPQWRWCWTWDTPITFLCCHAGRNCILQLSLLLLHQFFAFSSSQFFLLQNKTNSFSGIACTEHIFYLWHFLTGVTALSFVFLGTW